MLGRATGVCGGRAGSMNVIDLEHGLVGCFGIVGGSDRRRHRRGALGEAPGRVAVAFFGDGATNQGYFHECLNFAAVGALPAVFVCENNLYGEFTPMARGHRRRRHRRARGGVRDAAPRSSTATTSTPSHETAARRSSAPAPAAARRSWSARPTATTATRRPTRRSTARRRGRALARARPARARPRATARRRRRGATRSRPSSATSARGSTRRSRARTAAPYPDPRDERATEFAA